MFKKIYFMLLCLMLPLAFTSCGGDDDDNEPKSGSIVGSWYTSIYGYGEATVTFGKDGKFTATYTEEGEIYHDRGTYKYNAPLLIITTTWSDFEEDNDDLPFTQTLQAYIDGDELMIVDDDYYQIYKRKK